MQLHTCIISLTLILSNQSIFPTFTLQYNFWGNSSNSRKIFNLQKKIVRLMTGAKPGNSCKHLFKRLEILTLSCEFICILINKLNCKQLIRFSK
jgi:hypothetical protein